MEPVRYLVIGYNHKSADNYDSMSAKKARHWNLRLVSVLYEIHYDLPQLLSVILEISF